MIRNWTLTRLRGGLNLKKRSGAEFQGRGNACGGTKSNGEKHPPSRGRHGLMDKKKKRSHNANSMDG